MDLSSYPFPENARSIWVRNDAHSSTVDPPPPNKKPDNDAEVALRFESPAWLAIASGDDSHRQKLTPAINMTKIKGRESDEEKKVHPTDNLQPLLDEIDPQTKILHIFGDASTNDEWELLGQHFTSVRFLKVATGWHEDWVDDKFPLNWPLELLVIADATSELITTPAILEGRIRHLVLLLTAGLRFEGPSTKELMKDAEQLDVFYPQKTEKDSQSQTEAEPSGTPQSQADGSTPSSSKDDATSPSPEPESKPQGLKVYSVPHEWHKWFHAHYADKDLTFSSPDPDSSSPPSSMTHLQILGNDALQMLSYLALAKPHLLSSLSSLTLCSPKSNDLQHVPSHLPLTILPALKSLQTFRLTLGSAMYTTFLSLFDESQPFLHAFLPPNVEALYLRGPVTMAPHLDEFAAAFEYGGFLPRLKRVSLVLDLPDKSSDSPREASLEQLRAAHRACRRVLDAAVRERGVVVEGFGEPWVEEHGRLFGRVDERWGVLDEVARV